MDLPVSADPTSRPPAAGTHLAELARRCDVDESLIRDWLRLGVVQATAPPERAANGRRRRFTDAEAAAVRFVAAARLLGIQPHKLASAVRWLTSARWKRGWRGWIVLGPDGQVYGQIEDTGGPPDVEGVARQLVQFPAPGFALVRFEAPEEHEGGT